MSTSTQSDSRGRLWSQSPVVAAVDNSAPSQAAIDAGVALARELNAPLVFAYVRRGPPSFLGAPVYQQRLTKKMDGATTTPDGRSVKRTRLAPVRSLRRRDGRTS